MNFNKLDNIKEEEEKRHKFMRESAQYLSIGTETFLPIVIGALVGYYLIDEKYDTKPLWTIVLSLLGFVVGMYSLFKMVLKVKKKD